MPREVVSSHDAGENEPMSVPPPPSGEPVQPAPAPLAPGPRSPASRAPVQLAVSGLRVRFGPLTALDGVDLTVRAGELVALAGENGAGKSTLIRCIAGDITPTSGVIALEGRPVPADPQGAKRQGISVVWQDLALCDNLDIAANVMLGRERRRQLLSSMRMRSDAGALLEAAGRAAA